MQTSELWKGALGILGWNGWVYIVLTVILFFKFFDRHQYLQIGLLGLALIFLILQTLAGTAVSLLIVVPLSCLGWLAYGQLKRIMDAQERSQERSEAIRQAIMLGDAEVCVCPVCDSQVACGKRLNIRADYVFCENCKGWFKRTENVAGPRQEKA